MISKTDSASPKNVPAASSSSARRDGVVDVADGGLRAAVVLLGELEQARLGAHGLAPERVRRAELLLVAPREPGAERVAVAVAERVRWRGG